MRKSRGTAAAAVNADQMEQTGKKAQKGVGFGKLMAWSLRSASTGIAFLIMGYLSLFCTNTLGVRAEAVGIILLISKLFDGVTDLLAGYIIDRTNTKIGRGRPYELCIIGLWISTVLLFMCPPELSTAMKYVWIFAMYTVANSVFMTFLNANGTVYMVRAFSNPSDYVALSTYGGLVPMIVSVAFNIVFPIMVSSMATSQAGWIRMVVTCAVPLLFIGLLRFFVIKETNQVDVGSSEKPDLHRIFGVLKQNKYIFFVAIAMLVYNLVTNMGINQYYFTTVVGNLALLSALSAIQMIALPMMVILPQILKKTTVVRVMTVGLIVTVIGYILNFFAGANFAMLAIAAVMTGAGVVPISMLSGLLIIDCADYNEYRGLDRLEGSLNAVISFATKIGSGLGSGLLGILIGAAGYDGTLAVQPASAVMMIRLLYSFIPAALFLLVIIALRFYKLDDKMPEIRKTNEARRAAGK